MLWNGAEDSTSKYIFYSHIKSQVKIFNSRLVILASSSRYCRCRRWVNKWVLPHLPLRSGLKKYIVQTHYCSILHEERNSSINYPPQILFRRITLTLNLKSPIGGFAYGIPLKAQNFSFSTLRCTTPRSVPFFVCTIGSFMLSRPSSTEVDVSRGIPSNQPIDFIINLFNDYLCIDYLCMIWQSMHFGRQARVLM